MGCRSSKVANSSSDVGQQPFPVELKEGGYVASSSRGCTDVLFLLLFVLTLAGLAVVAGVAFSSGSIWRLIRATDFQGNACGVSGTEPPASELSVVGGGASWGERVNIWYPILPLSSYPVPYSAGTLSLGEGNSLTQVGRALRTGVCVKTCPTMTYLAVNGTASQTSVLDPTSYLVSYSSRIQYPVYYQSSVYFYRCVPTFTGVDVLDVYQADPQLMAEAQDLQSVLNLSGFVVRGINELGGVWRVLVICVLTSVAIAILYIYLLRLFAKPLLVATLFSIFAALVVLGVLFWLQGSTFTHTDAQYGVAYKVLAIVLWVLAGLYLLLLVWFLRQIRIALELIRMASVVVSSTWTLVLVPLLCYALVVAAAVFCLLVALYLETAATLKTDVISMSVPGPMGPQAANLTTSFFQQKNSMEYLLLYDLFAFLWVIGMINALGFITIAMVSVFWYFSRPGNEKSLPSFPVFKALRIIFRYHVGTAACGSLIIAVVQLIRFCVSLLQRRMKAFAGRTHTKCCARFCLCCVQCCLRCWERVLNIINRNAYVVTCIKGTGFCRSAFTAVQLIISCLGDMVVVNFVAEAMFLLSCVSLTLLNVFVCWLIMRYTTITPDQSTLVVPLVAVALLSYAIFRLFLTVFRSVEDALLLCFCYDKEQNDGSPSRPYYLTNSLKSIIHKYNAEPPKQTILVQQSPVKE